MRSLSASGSRMVDATLNLEEAAAFLRLHPSTLMQRVHEGALPAAKPGRRWVFLQSDLEAYLRRLQGGPCRYTSGAASGGCISSIRDAELDALLATGKNRKRNDCTTNSAPSSGNAASTVATPGRTRPRNGLKLVRGA